MRFDAPCVFKPNNNPSNDVILKEFTFDFSSFLETNVPLLVLVEAARNGNEKEVEEYAQVSSALEMFYMFL